MHVDRHPGKRVGDSLNSIITDAVNLETTILATLSYEYHGDFWLHFNLKKLQINDLHVLCLE